MDFRLNDTERKVLEVLWREGDTTAKQISDFLKEETGWNINTTYTIIKKCIAKGLIERREPNFICHALLTRQEARQKETNTFLDKVFGGAADKLFATLLSAEKLSDQQLKEIQEMIAQRSR